MIVCMHQSCLLASFLFGKVGGEGTDAHASPHMTPVRIDGELRGLRARQCVFSATWQQIHVLLSREPEARQCVLRRWLQIKHAHAQLRPGEVDRTGAVVLDICRS
jgi:hypothetical protein